jgi:phage tail protein X
MATYTTVLGQNIYDLSVLLYGNTTNIVKLVQDNPGLDRVSKNIPAGTVITYDAQSGNDVVDFFSNKEVSPVTGDRDLGAGGGFDSGFDLTGFY